MSKEVSILLENYRSNYDVKITPFIESVTSYKTYRRKVMTGESLNMFTLFDLIDKTYYSYYEFFYSAHRMIYGYDLLHNLGSFMIGSNEEFFKDGYDQYLQRLKLKPNILKKISATTQNIKLGKIKEHLLDLNNIIGPLEQESVIKHYQFTHGLIEQLDFENWLEAHFSEQYFSVKSDFDLAHICLLYFKHFKQQKDLNMEKYFSFLLNINHWTSGYMMKLIAANWFFSVVTQDELNHHIDLYHQYTEVLDQLLEYGARNHHFMEHYYYHKANYAYLNQEKTVFELNIAKYVLTIKLIEPKDELRSLLGQLKKTFSVDLIHIVLQYVNHNLIK